MHSIKKYGIVNNVVRTQKLDYVPDPRGAGYVFYTHMQKFSQKILQIDGLTGETDTFGSFRTRCVRTALAMRARGLRPQDTITLCTLNHLDSCVPFFAAMFAGVIPTSVDPAMSLDDVSHLLQQVEPKLIFVAPDAIELIAEAVKELKTIPEIVVFGETNGYIPFASFLTSCEEEEEFYPYQPANLQETLVIFFSSGTSGLPKGICINHLTLLCQSVNTIGFGYSLDVTLMYASVYWAISAVFWGANIISGTSKLVLPKFDEKIIWEKIDLFKPSLVFIAPRHTVLMYNEGRPSNIDTKSVKDVCVAGGSMLEDQVAKIRSLMPETRVCLTYGQTEVAGYLTGFLPSNPNLNDFIRNKPTSSGSPVSGISYKVVDPDTEELLGANQVGEIRVKTDYQLNGYYKMDSSGVWDSHGWLITGDIGYYDEDCYFFIVDRIKELLKYRSFQVAPASIENVLLGHPRIKSAVVIGRPHEIDGDLPMAVVVLKEPRDVCEEEIVKYVEERVHDRKRLRGGVKFVDCIPVTPTGKVRRRDAKKMFV